MSTKHSSKNSSAKDTSTESAPTSQRISSIVHEAIDSASDRAEKVEKKLRTEADHLAEKSSAAAADAKRQLEDSVNGLDKFVRERPFTAAGIAFAAGVLGTLLVKK